ncbi:MAG: hypothetical protein ACFFAQ_16280 [Promethearchaeota archaeon]
MVIIARCKEDVGISAIDFFSFVHITFGFFSFLALYCLLYILFGIPINFFYLSLNLLAAIIWETIENFILYEFKLKYKHRRDSKINSFMDIIFFFIGGLLGFYIVFLELHLFFISTIIILSSSLLVTDIYALIILKLKENTHTRE